ncbi:MULTISPECIES: phosphoribosylglycinamide formyltransferase [Bartonella]|uniref:phosphoribosylglycinamide formyltransferase n=1 Tax=Bartonella TaxID=773 RepID=UPI0018DB4AE8|nr:MULTISPECIES: phosphoribosylglycinamide formyltransferase [Bartonella]MBI0169056.1 phosphoribosylglycinamide formyltransferase [Bartonella sp. W8167]MBI0174956.1 phosphoribosylglycinamide formyltransferase [Bartonella apis]
MKKKVVILISGSGTNMVSLVEATRTNDFPAEVVAVISDNKDAKGIEKARILGLSTYIIERKNFTDKQTFETALLDRINACQPDIVCLAGFMRLISQRIIGPYEGRILNIHPALLPLFRGLHTHQRALDAGVKITGCTVHLVTEGMDEGTILGQAAVPVLENDTADSLAERVLKVEHKLYPATLRAFIEKPHKEVNADQQIISY